MTILRKLGLEIMKKSCMMFSNDGWYEKKLPPEMTLFITGFEAHLVFGPNLGGKRLL